MSDAFRDLLRKVGSGSHTSKDLSRTEAAAATRMMLLQEATPAQIGAFMISHRIKRPTGEELAGMLDAYDELGPKLAPIAAAHRPLVMSVPYDGRSRTAPVTPLIALVLAAAGCPVVLHGGDRMPTKHGLPLIEIWQHWGVDWASLSLTQTQSIFAETGVGFVYLPRHFPLANDLVPYRDQIGKRPPFATLELFWCPYAGDCTIVSGFVHPPTEEMAQKAFALRNTPQFVTVKGLEGSCDLPRDRTCIVGINQPKTASFDRLLLHPRDYGFAAAEVPLGSDADYLAAIDATLHGAESELLETAIWSSGFYLWVGGVSPTLAAGLETARDFLKSGQVAQQLDRLRSAVKEQRSTPEKIPATSS